MSKPDRGKEAATSKVRVGPPKKCVFPGESRHPLLVRGSKAREEDWARFWAGQSHPMWAAAAVAPQLPPLELALDSSQRAALHTNLLSRAERVGGRRPRCCCRGLSPASKDRHLTARKPTTHARGEATWSPGARAAGTSVHTDHAGDSWAEREHSSYQYRPT